MESGEETLPPPRNFPPQAPPPPRPSALQGRASSGTHAVRLALQFRPLDSSEKCIARVVEIVLEYVEALSKSPSDADGAELDGALDAIDVINRLAWRYFVEHKPAEGHSVLQKVTTTVSLSARGSLRDA